MDTPIVGLQVLWNIAVVFSDEKPLKQKEIIFHLRLYSSHTTASTSSFVFALTTLSLRLLALKELAL